MTKAKLVILSAQYRGKIFELTKEKYSCGRDPARDICIPDTTISSYHCDFIRSGSNYVVIDRGSTNGTKVNNEPVTEQLLNHTDLLSLGMVETLYESDDGTMTVTKANTNIDLSVDNDMTKTVVCTSAPYLTQKAKSYAPRAGKENKLFLFIVFILGALIAILIWVLVSALFPKKINHESAGEHPAASVTIVV